MKKYVVHRANTRKVKSFICSHGNNAKTDKLDAKALARYGFERYQFLEVYIPPAPNLFDLYQLAGRRRDLKQILVAEKNRLQATYASLAGVAPRANESGKYKGYRSVAKGRGIIKPILFLAAMSARRSNSDLKIFYETLIAKGKKKMVALTALMRKLIVRANAKLRDLELKQYNEDEMTT
jgi:transposase